jgi:hypothetical protein
MLPFRQHLALLATLFLCHELFMTARVPTPDKNPKLASAPAPTGLSIRFARGTEEIRNLAHWSTLAPPKSSPRRKPRRSVMESARAWCRSDGACVPHEVRDLLESNPRTRGVKLSDGEPEKGIVFDRLKGEPRNADVALLGTDSRGDIIAITIEAKADESFGPTFQQAVAASVERIVSGKPSNGVSRAEALAIALLPPRRAGKTVSPEERTPSLGPLRYQLFTAVAGTLAFAHQSSAKLAVFIIHEFVTDCTRDEDHKANALDLNAFVSRLSDGAIRELRSGQIVGPFPVIENSYWPSKPALYIGKATKNIRDARLAPKVSGPPDPKRTVT